MKKIFSGLGDWELKVTCNNIDNGEKLVHFSIFLVVSICNNQSVSISGSMTLNPPTLDPPTFNPRHLIPRHLIPRPVNTPTLNPPDT